MAGNQSFYGFSNPTPLSFVKIGDTGPQQAATAATLDCMIGGGGYSHLFLLYLVRTDAVSQTTFNVRFNGDATSGNYTSQRVGVANSAGQTAGRFSIGHLWVYDYSNPSTAKNANGVMMRPDGTADGGDILWTPGTAFRKDVWMVTLVPASGSWIAGSRMWAYGLP